MSSYDLLPWHDFVEEDLNAEQYPFEDDYVEEQCPFEDDFVEEQYPFEDEYAEEDLETEQYPFEDNHVEEGTEIEQYPFEDDHVEEDVGTEQFPFEDEFVEEDVDNEGYPEPEMQDYFVEECIDNEEYPETQLQDDFAEDYIGNDEFVGEDIDNDENPGPQEFPYGYDCEYDYGYDYDLNLEDHINETRDNITTRDEITKDNDTQSLIGHSERNSLNTGDHQAHRRRNTGWSYRKVDIEKMFVITNFVLEIPSAVFDQLSSVHKPKYALVSMLMSFAAMVMCIVELVYKARKENFSWKWRNALPWLYYPSHRHKPFGNFKDIIGLVCAFCQCIFATITFDFVRRHADNPIKISVWPIVFAFGLLCSKFSEKPERRSG